LILASFSLTRFYKILFSHPGFTDAANGNFKVSNQTIIDNEIGDPRWRK